MLGLSKASRKNHEESCKHNLLLLVIALALVALALRPLRQPRAAHAQAFAPYPIYIEPGTQMLRAPDGSQNIYGKMVVDLQTGKVCGFPALTAQPYPVDVSGTKPQVSHPFLLGTFDFDDMQK